MGYFHEVNTLYYRQWGVPSYPFTPCQTTDQDGSSSKHVRAAAKDICLFSQGLTDCRLTHQGFASWWICPLLLLTGPSSLNIVFRGAPRDSKLYPLQEAFKLSSWDTVYMHSSCGPPCPWPTFTRQFIKAATCCHSRQPLCWLLGQPIHS